MQSNTKVWYPFTQMKDWFLETPLTIERGKGIYLYDTKGRKYIDGISSLWVNVHGHRKKEIDEAIKKQIDKISHSTLLGLENVPAKKLADELVKITPQRLKRVFYSDSGSTAVEIALKIAFQYWQQRKPGQKVKAPQKKQKFIYLKNSYHGDTLGSVSVGGIDLFHKLYQPLLFHGFKVPIDLKKIEAIMKRQYQKIAALIMEPLIQGAAGMLTQPPGFLKGVERLCHKYQILLIADEVATGFGRTGKMFAIEHEKVSPDIMCLAKGITGGYLPLAATLTSEKIFQAFLGKGKTFFHGHTYTGNPLATASALANLKIFKKEKTLKNLEEKIQLLKEELKKFKKFGEVRQCGFMVGIEIAGFKPEDKIGHQVILEARKRGAILRPLGNVIVLMPPLSISQKELKKLLKITFDSITTITENSSKK